MSVIQNEKDAFYFTTLASNSEEMGLIFLIKKFVFPLFQC